MKNERAAHQEGDIWLSAPEASAGFKGELMRAAESAASGSAPPQCRQLTFEWLARIKSRDHPPSHPSRDFVRRVDQRRRMVRASATDGAFSPGDPDFA